MNRTVINGSTENNSIAERSRIVDSVMVDSVIEQANQQIQCKSPRTKQPKAHPAYYFERGRARAVDGLPVSCAADFAGSLGPHR